MPTEIAVALLSIASAVVGYAFREYRNRVRPFFQVVSLSGNTTKRTDHLRDPADVKEADRCAGQIEGSFLLNAIAAPYSLGDLHELAGIARQVTDTWPDLRTKIDAALAAKSRTEFVPALGNVFASSPFDLWMLRCIVSERIRVPSIHNPGEDVIGVFPSSEHGGSRWLIFGGKSSNFGSNMDNKAVEALSMPFLDAVRTADQDVLGTTLREFRTIMNATETVAARILPPIQGMLDKFSRWRFGCYFANLSGSPLVLEQDAMLLIDDSRGVSFREPCYLAIPKEDENFEGDLLDARRPQVIRAGEGVSIVFLTTQVQNEMDLGGSLRESFDKGTGRARIRVKVRKPGLFSMQDVSSASTQFSDTAQATAEGVSRAATAHN